MNKWMNNHQESLGIYRLSSPEIIKTKPTLIPTQIPHWNLSTFYFYFHFHSTEVTVQAADNRMSRLSNFYLLTYNSLQAFGWYVPFFSPYLLIFFFFFFCHHGSVFLVGRTISLYRLLDSFVATKSTSGAYSSVGELICKFQAISLVPWKVCRIW